MSDQQVKPQSVGSSTPRSRRPSAALGHVIGFLAGVLLAWVIIGELPPRPSDRTPEGIIKFHEKEEQWKARCMLGALAGVLAYWGVKQAINRTRRYPSAVTSTPPPLAASQKPVVEQVPPLLVQRGLVAGRWEGENFVISPDEMGAVIKNTTAFSNVLVGEDMESSLQTLTGRGKWYFVLAKGQAVVFSQDCETVWTVVPEAVTIRPEKKVIQDVFQMVEIRAVDGSFQDVAVDPTRIIAWQSKTLEEFCEKVEQIGRAHV